VGVTWVAHLPALVGWILLGALAMLGHGLLWSAIVGGIHAADLPRRWLQILTALCSLLVMLIPFAAIGWCAWVGWPASAAAGGPAWTSVQVLPVVAYLGLCVLSGVVGTGRVVWRRLSYRPPEVLRSETRRLLGLDMAGAARSPEECTHHLLARLPVNETLQLELCRRTIELPRLPEALDGLLIVQLSDFHFTGRVGKAYFREVVARANELQPDLIALTGDLVDHTRWIDWIPELLGGLNARYGVYVVLGNHDARTDPVLARQALRAAGLVDLGSQWIEITLRGERVVLAGNELPWLGPAADWATCPAPAGAGGPLRIALGHSPDQLPWARQGEVDLFLVGHTHGGQIRLPWLGALLTPSRHGIKYADGVFYEPPTVMHVTRGVSGELPLRWNCPPELVLLELCRGKEPR